MNEPPFLHLLHRGGDAGFQTDDVLAAVLPLFRQVAAWHEEGLVAPLDGIERLTVDKDGALRYVGDPAAPKANPTKIAQLQRTDRQRAACGRTRARDFR